MRRPGDFVRYLLLVAALLCCAAPSSAKKRRSKTRDTVTLTRTTVDAKGRQESIATVTEFGRYAFTVKSKSFPMISPSGITTSQKRTTQQWVVTRSSPGTC